MAKLKTTHVKEVNEFLLQNNLFGHINRYLRENGLTGYEVASLHLKLKERDIFNDAECSGMDCPPGQRGVQVCTTSGKCECQCVPF